ncbi:MAG: YqjK family protein [Tepidimonas taiwanensis]|nr:YqjK family protein [Tepidimonas taiwanensis]
MAARTDTPIAIPLRERLAVRHQALLQRSAELRERLSREAQVLRPAADGVDRVRASWRWLRAHPWVPVAAAFALALYRPRRAWATLWLVWRGWRWWCRVKPLWARVTGRASPRASGWPA